MVCARSRSDMTEPWTTTFTVTPPPMPPFCPPLIIRRLCGLENTRAPRGRLTSSGPYSPTSAIPPGDTPPWANENALPTVRKNVVTVVDHEVGMLYTAFLIP